MTHHPPREASKTVPAKARGPRAWLIQALDSLLSEELRRGPPLELSRYRLLAGACCYLLLQTLLSLVVLEPLVPRLPIVLTGLGFVIALWLLRRATSHLAPSVVLCASMLLGTSLMVFLLKKKLPYIGMHASHMLMPALAVYLLGPRWGFFFTLGTILVMGVLYPLHYLGLVGQDVASEALLGPMSLFACIAFVGAWGLASLHSTARNEAQSTLEQTLKELRENERKLISLFESTDDMVSLLDARGHLLIANAAAKKAYRLVFGHEPFVGAPYFPESAPELHAVWAPRLAKVLTGERLRYEETGRMGDALVTVEISLNPVWGVSGNVAGVTIFARDMTERKNAEARLGEMHRTLVDVSRQAGMAEIATGVLHNVGNTLNSVNVSATLAIEQVSQSRLMGLAKVAALLHEHDSDLAAFLTEDPQGRKLPAYLTTLSERLQQEQAVLLGELRSLSSSVDHIKSIVSTQQKHARSAGTLEEVAVSQLIDEALRLHAVSFERLGISIEREYAPDVPPLIVDRHRLLQILVNLLSNAREALTSSDTEDKRLTIRIHRAPEGERVLIQVADNGSGIAPENLPRMFTQGFTTKKEGHGFGLHISALAAREMKGQLTCTSEGPGRGATFTLELPMEGS